MAIALLCGGIWLAGRFAPLRTGLAACLGLGFLTVSFGSPALAVWLHLRDGHLGTAAVSAVLSIFLWVPGVFYLRHIAARRRRT